MSGISMDGLFKKILTAILPVALVIIAFSAGIAAADDPLAASPASKSDDIGAISKDIHAEIKGLGYSEDIDIDLVQMANSWNYIDWRQSISQAKRDLGEKKISADQAAEIEEKILNDLVKAIAKEFKPAPSKSEYYYLSKVMKDRTAQNLGYAQLLFVLGNPLGLNVKAVDVRKPAEGFLPVGEDYFLCLVGLSNNKTIAVDLSESFVSRTFSPSEQYIVVGNYWELKSKDNPLKLPRRIRILDRNGIVAQLYANLAEKYAESDKDDKAISLYAKAIELNPKFAQAYSSRGVVYLKLKQAKEAGSDLEKAVALDPKNAEAYCNLGTFYMRTGQAEKAFSCLSKAIELKPTLAVAYKTRAMLLLQTGKQAEGVADLDKTTELDPKEPQPYIIRGSIYTHDGKNDKAIEELSKAIELDPKNAEAYNSRGVLYSKLDKYTDAISDFMKATEINPNYADAYFNRALNYARMDDVQKALDFYTQGLRINPKHIGAYNGRGTCFLQLKQFPEAKADFTKALQLNPRFAEAYFNRGLTRLLMDEKEEAKKDLSRAAELNPAMKDAVNKKLAEIK